MEEILSWLNGDRTYSSGVELYRKWGRNELLQRLFNEAWSPFKEQKLLQAMQQLATDLPKSDYKVPSFSNEFTPLGTTETTDVTQVEDLRTEIDNLAYDNQVLEEEKEDLEFEKHELEGQVEQLTTENKQLQQAAKAAPKGWPAQMDETVKGLHDTWLPLFSQKKNLQSRIYDVAKAGEADPGKKAEACAMAHSILDLRDACRKIYKQRDHYLQHGQLPPAPPALPGLSENPLQWPVKLQNHHRYLRDYNAQLAKATDAKRIERIKTNIATQEAYIAEYKRRLGISDHE